MLLNTVISNTVISIALTVSAQAAEADTLIVRLNAPHRSLEADEDLRLGSIDGAVESTFGWVSGLVVSETDVMYVADGQATALRMFDPSGAYLGDVGREGGGPGEYDGLHGLAITRGGEVVTWDYNSQRVSYFGPRGEFRRSFRTDVRGILGNSGPSAVVDTTDHVMILTAGDPSMWQTSSGPSEAIHGWLRYSPEGEFVDSMLPPRREVAGSYNGFKLETASALSPWGFFVTGRNDEYALHRSLADGRVLRMERSWEPVPLERGERRQWEAHQEEWERRWGYASPDIPSHKPAWRELFVDTDGRIWVSRYVEAEHVPGFTTTASERGGWPAVEWIQPVVFDLIDPRGSYLGTATLPYGSEFLFARGASLWVRQRGELDEHYVVRYSLRLGPYRAPSLRSPALRPDSGPGHDRRDGSDDARADGGHEAHRQR